MDKDQDNPDYEIGYKKPPKNSQFKAGQSGNRKGRPKGSLNFSTEINKELETRVTVKENGQNKQVSKKRIIAKQLVNKAAGGDLKASGMLINYANISEQNQMAKAFVVSETISREDQQVMDNLVRRIRESAGHEPVISTGLADTAETGATPIPPIPPIPVAPADDSDEGGPA